MSDAISIELPFPPSVNALWRRGRSGMYRAPRYMTWINAAGWQLKGQRPGRISGDYILVIQLERRDRRKRDADNFIKAVSDLLVSHGVIEDDALAQSVTAIWSDNIKGCRVVVTPVPTSARASIKKRAA